MLQTLHSDPKQQPIRLDHFLVNKIEKVSREKIQRAIREGAILINGKSKKPNYILKGNEKIEIYELNSLTNPLNLTPENIKLEIVYEDEDLLIINKHAGIVVHPGCNNLSGTIANALVHHFSKLPSKNNDPQRPGLVHRLDKNTSGLLLIAKNEFSMTYLAKQFENHSIERTYIALAWHNIPQDYQIIEKPLTKSAQEKKVLVATNIHNGKYAKTHVKVLKRYGFTTLIECTLETGRTHQIRVHLNSIGNPIFGDDLYGGQIFPSITTITKCNKFLQNAYNLMPHQALYAKTLGFIHPRTKKKLFFEIEMPENFSKLLEKVEKFVIL